MVFVSGKRNVTLSKAETLEITNTTYNENDIEVNVTVRNSYKNKFEMPLNKDDFQIEASDSSDVVFTYTRSDANRGTIKINDNTPLKALSFMIFANDYRVRVEVTPVYSEHLTFDVGTSHLADYKKDFTFKISAINVTNSYYYYVPYALSIELADGTILPSGAYNITALDEERQNATCTIYAQYMVQDFKISGDAAHVDYFESYIYVCGATIEWTGKNEVLEYHKKGEKVDHYFLADVGSARFDADRVIVEDKDGNLYRLSDPDLPDIYKDKITINANNLNIAQNVEFDYVAIYLAADNITVFDKLDWKIINGINEKGWRDSFFDVGDTKKITINRVTYDARIIGFDHDNLTFVTGKAKMTIELAQVITLDDGSALLGKFDERIGEDFRKTIYDDYLQKNFYPLFPTDLRSYVKEVNKPVETWDGSQERKLESYDTKIFPLSVKELNLEHAFYWHPEGDTYAYYNSDDDSKQIKKNCEVSGSVVNPVSYWTRSVLQADDYHQSCYVNESGKTRSKDVDNKIGYMVAFCI